MTLTDIMHPTRVKVLKLLGEGSQTLAEIAQNLDLSKPEISRHLARMRELNLVEKGDKIHQLTSLGEVFLHLTSPIEFLLDNYDYFMNHIIDLPFSYVRDIDSLVQSELISGMGYFMSRIEEIREDTVKEVKMMVDQPFPGGSEQVETALFIVPLYAKSENLSLDLLLKTSQYFEFRTLPVITPALGIINRKYGFLFFPERITGKIDYNNVFFVTDQLGLDFLSQLWDHFWDRSEFRISSTHGL